MNWENIGSCGNGTYQDDPEWKMFCLNMGLSYLNLVVGKLPSGCELRVMWQEDAIEKTPAIGFCYDATHDDPPWETIDQCERLLELFDDSVSWDEIDPHFAFEHLNDEITEIGEFDDHDEYDNRDLFDDEEFEDTESGNNKIH